MSRRALVAGGVIGSAGKGSRIVIRVKQIDVKDGIAKVAAGVQTKLVVDGPRPL